MQVRINDEAERLCSAESEKYMIIKNREQVVNELTEILVKFEKNLNNYQTDVYAYYDIDTQEVKLDTFVNVGGNSWRDDDHITIYVDKEHHESPVDIYENMSDIADAVGIELSKLISEVADEEDIADDDVTLLDVSCYVKENYLDEIQESYEEYIDDIRGDIYNQAEEIISKYERECDVDIIERAHYKEFLELIAAGKSIEEITNEYAIKLNLNNIEE